MSVFRAGRLVQRIDVLGDGEDAAACSLSSRASARWAAFGRASPSRAPAEIVEFVHADRIAGEAFGRRHLLRSNSSHNPAFVAERAEPALGRKPGPGENDDAAKSH